MKPITLMEDEPSYVSKLGIFDVMEFDHGSQEYYDCIDASYELTISLLERDAIPPERLRYFFDSDYNLSRGNLSKKENIERNQYSDESVYRNGAYLKYLRFFLYGANLPTTFISKLDTIYNDEFYDDYRVEKNGTAISSLFQ